MAEEFGHFKDWKQACGGGGGDGDQLAPGDVMCCSFITGYY